MHLGRIHALVFGLIIQSERNVNVFIYSKLKLHIEFKQERMNSRNQIPPPRRWKYKYLILTDAQLLNGDEVVDFCTDLRNSVQI